MTARVERISKHVVRVTAEPFPTVAAARKAYEKVERELPPGTVALYVQEPQKKPAESSQGRGASGSQGSSQ